MRTARDFTCEPKGPVGKLQRCNFDVPFRGVRSHCTLRIEPGDGSISVEMCYHDSGLARKWWIG